MSGGLIFGIVALSIAFLGFGILMPIGILISNPKNKYGWAFALFAISAGIVAFWVFALVLPNARDELFVKNVISASKDPESNFDFLVEVLQDGGPSEAMETAARALGQTRDPAATDALLTALTRDPREGKWGRRPEQVEAVIWALGETGVGNQRVVQALIPFLEGTYSHCSADVLLKVNDFHDRDAIDALLDAALYHNMYFNDSELADRIIDSLLNEGRRSEVTAALMELLTSSSSHSSARQLVRIGDSGDTRVLDALLNVVEYELGSESPWEFQGWYDYYDCGDILQFLVQGGKQTEAIQAFVPLLIQDWGIASWSIASVLEQLGYVPDGDEQLVTWNLIQQERSPNIDGLRGSGTFQDPWRVTAGESRQQVVAVLSGYLLSHDDIKRAFAMDIVLNEYCPEGCFVFDYPELWDTAAGVFVELGSETLAKSLFERGYEDLADQWASRRGLVIYWDYR